MVWASVLLKCHRKRDLSHSSTLFSSLQLTLASLVLGTSEKLVPTLPKWLKEMIKVITTCFCMTAQPETQNQAYLALKLILRVLKRHSATTIHLPRRSGPPQIMSNSTNKLITVSHRSYRHQTKSKEGEKLGLSAQSVQVRTPLTLTQSYHHVAWLQEGTLTKSRRILCTHYQSISLEHRRKRAI